MDSPLAPESRRRFERELRFLRNRFSPEGYLGLHLTIGVVIILLAGWCFSEIARTLGPNEPLLDQQIATWFYEQGRPQLTTAARALTFFASTGFLSGATICCGLFFIRQKAWSSLLALFATMCGGGLLNIVLKHFFQRHRPVFENPLVTLTSFGFPSGHTMGATLFYGLLAVFAVHALRSMVGRLMACALAAIIVATIGLTRMYLGAHFLTDVLAAIAAGLAWLAFSWTAVETFRRRRRREKRPL